jgi:TP901 family phage tail tape measure protein
MANDQVSVEISIEEQAALKALTRLSKEFKDTENEAKKSFTRIDGFISSFAGNLASNAVSAVTQFAKSFAVDGVRAAAAFEKSLIEINTILPKNTSLTKDQVQSLRDLAKEYGTSATDQAKSFYQVVSAGITDTAKAAEALEVANKLAVGGLSNVEGSIDVLTSILNVYGQENISAEEAADSLFKTVQIGKTTIDELNQSLGLALPSAQAAGVGLNDLNAAIALLTANGRKTSVAVTEVNALLSAFARNGDKLGKGLDLTAVQTEGLATVVARLTTVTGGSSDKLIELLGSQEAVRAALTLGAKSGETYNKFLRDVSTNAGATSDAFNLVAQSADFQFKQLQAELEDLKITLGNELLPIIISVGKFLRDALSFDGSSALESLGVDKIRQEISALKKEAEAIKNNPLNLPEFLMGDAAETDARIAKYEAQLQKLLKDEKNLVEERIANQNVQTQLTSALLGGRGEFVSSPETQAPSAAPVNASAAPAAIAGVNPFGLSAEEAAAEREKILAERVLLQQQLDTLSVSQQELKSQKKIEDLATSEADRELEKQKLLDFELSKIDIQLQAELEKNKQIKDARNRDLADKLAYQKAELSSDRAQLKEKNRLQQQEEAIRQKNLEGIGFAINTAANLAQQGTKEQKALAIAAATINTYAAGARAFRDYPYPANLAVLAATVATGLVQVSKIANTSFQNGGVFGGFSGATNGADNTTANVRTGEMILNASQQRRLFDIATGADTSRGSGVVNAIERLASQPIVVQIDGREIARTVRSQKADGFSI